MRRLFALFSFLAFASATVFADDGEGQWMMHYYKHPTPDAVAAKLSAWQQQGLLKKKDTQPVMIGFVLRVMQDNPGKAVEWLKMAESFPPVDRQAIRIAAWYSKVPAAQEYLDFNNFREFAHRVPPDVASLPIESPASVDFNWAMFYASGDPAVLRRIIGTFRFGMDYGASDRLATSEQRDPDRISAANDETFRAARWSVESNCQQDQTIYDLCSGFLYSGKLSEIEQAALRQCLGSAKIILPDLKPEDAKTESSKTEPSKPAK